MRGHAVACWPSIFLLSAQLQCSWSSGAHAAHASGAGVDEVEIDGPVSVGQSTCKYKYAKGAQQLELMAIHRSAMIENGERPAPKAWYTN